MADRWESSEGRRDRYLQLILEGKSHKEAQQAMGITRGGYLAWRKRFPEWKARVDVAKRTVGDHDAAAALGDTASLEDKRLVYFHHDSYWHHREMIRSINDCPDGGIVMILLPPDHGKSTVISELCTIWIGENPNARVGYVTETLGLSRKAVNRVKRRLEPEAARQFQRFHADHGPFVDVGRSSKPWAADYFTVFKSDHDEADYTMEARAVTGNIAGTRLDKMILDDIQSRHNIEATDKIVGDLRQDFLSRVRDDGITVIIGTRVDERDVYSELEKEGIVDRVVRLPATNGVLVDCPLGEQCDVPDIPHEEPLCPEMHTVHALAKRRHVVGEIAWARNYQQRPSDTEGKTFTPAMIEDARDRVSTRADVRVRLATWRRFAGLDPAVVGGNALVGVQACSTALRIIGAKRKFNMARSEAIIAEVDAAWLEWGGFTDLIVEQNAYQRALANDERLRNLGRLRGFTIHAHQTGANKNDVDFGVSAMASSLTDGEITWLYGDEQTRAEMSMLEVEMLAWRPDVPVKKLRQDLVMAAWFCWLHWTKRRRSWHEADIKRTSPWVTARTLPWRPQGIASVRALALPGARAQTPPGRGYG